MNKQFSIYLDFLRFSAAIAVFVSHVPGFSGGWFWQISGFGHEAVVFFFVLSGYVISFVTNEKNEKASEYAVNRLSRIYSVALPALILTVILYNAASWANPVAMEEIESRLVNPWWTFLSAILFINQSWQGTTIFTNLPYWSLAYEVLYYIAFGIAIYMKGIKRQVCLLIVCAIMGPSILLYLPIWLLGVACHRLRHTVQFSKPTAAALFLASVVGIAFLSLDKIQLIINGTMKGWIGDGFYNVLLEPAEKFAGDYLLAAFVVLHILTAFYLSRHLSVFNAFFEKHIRNLSSHTFSLYLYHMPFLYFVGAIAPNETYTILNLALCWIAVPVSIFILSSYTENKRYQYKLFFKRFIR